MCIFQDNFFIAKKNLVLQKKSFFKVCDMSLFFLFKDLKVQVDTV